MNTQVTDYINKAPDGQRKIMEAIRLLVHQFVSKVVEEFKWNRPVYRLKKDFAYLQATKDHVTLGFYANVEKIKDPDGLLEGTGKNMKHIKLRSIDDIDESLLKSWLAAVTEE